MMKVSPRKGRDVLSALKDQFENAGNRQQTHDKDDGDYPQNNFHLILPYRLKVARDWR